MQSLIESIARVTRSRQRDTLEASVIEVLASTVYPETLRLFRLVPVGNKMFVHCRVEAIGRQAPRLNPLPSRSGSLPPLELFPWVVDWFRQATVSPIEYDRPQGCCYLFPISDGVQSCGWIEMEQSRPLGTAERRMVTGLLAIYANHLSVIDYGERDSLTGLMNRKTFEDAFQQTLGSLYADETGRGGATDEAAGAEPDGATAAGFWLGVIDIDHFKRINDLFGHLYGDEVLVLLARQMRESFRLADRLYRFGGEEFAVLLDRTPAMYSGEVFDRFRGRVEAHKFPQIGQVTVSIGFTRIDAQDTPTRAFDRADAALYHAKRTGRNRVCSWDDLVATGVVSQRAENWEAELF